MVEMYGINHSAEPSSTRSPSIAIPRTTTIDMHPKIIVPNAPKIVVTHSDKVGVSETNVNINSGMNFYL